MIVECNCDDWVKGIEQIAVAQTSNLFKIHEDEYDPPTFLFCPWCGDLLHDVNTREKEIEEIETELTEINNEIALLQNTSSKLLDRAKELKEKEDE